MDGDDFYLLLPFLNFKLIQLTFFLHHVVICWFFEERNWPKAKIKLVVDLVDGKLNFGELLNKINRRQTGLHLRFA